jgi:hypothetical protein
LIGSTLRTCETSHLMALVDQMHRNRATYIAACASDENIHKMAATKA